MSSREAVWLPSPAQLQLLRASLWKGDRAGAAWVAWRSAEPDLDTVEQGSYRLLPLAYRNLGQLLGDDPDAARLRGIYRHSWAANQMGLRACRRALNALRNAGLEPLVLKGAALLESAYGDPGARPMDDVDIAIRPGQIGDAVRILQNAGLVSTADNPERALEVRHSIAFRDPDGHEVDLHRGMLWRPGLDREFWEGAVEAEVAGAPVRILNPTDQLLHVCAHGAAWNPVHPVRWAADAYKTIDAAPDELDWERLAAMARRGRLTLPLAAALEFLAESLEAPIPASTRRELSQAPVPIGERLAHAALAQPPSSKRSLAMLSWFWERYRAQVKLDGRQPHPAGFVRYMQGFWGLESALEVPGHAAGRALRRWTWRR